MGVDRRPPPVCEDQLKPPHLCVNTNPCPLTCTPPQGDASAAWSCHRLLLAKDLVDSLASKLGVQLTPLATFPGSQLEGCSYRHPLYERVSPVVIGGDYITTDTGKGVGRFYYSLLHLDVNHE